MVKGAIVQQNKGCLLSGCALSLEYSNDLKCVLKHIVFAIENFLKPRAAKM